VTEGHALVVARTRVELEAVLADRRSPGPARNLGHAAVALVPTMGALHACHARLVSEATAQAGTVVVSIFVNPLQFAPGEDLDRYPRTWDADLAVCAANGADVVFAPSVDEVYPGGDPQVTVEPGPLGVILEGASRPTHFRGVLTVVAKLFGLVRPNAAVFGEKDYQQLVLVRRMSSDLCMGVDVLGVPTVREASGLALSSRNKYLDEAQRELASALSQALRAGADAGARGVEQVLAEADAVLRTHAEIAVDYLALTSPELGAPPARGAARLLVAGRVGETRLIDNRAVVLGSPAVASAGDPIRDEPLDR